MIDHANLSIDAIDLADPTAPVSEALLLSSSVDEIELADLATGELIGEVAASNTADAETVLKRARGQAEDGRWSQMSTEERRVLLERLAGVLEDKADALAELATLESGTPVSMSRSVHVDTPLQVLRDAEVAPAEHGLDAAILGVNQPMYFALRTIATSLAAGHGTVIVPSILAPLTTVALMNCLLEADLPKGVVSAVYGTSDVLNVIRASNAFSTFTDVGPGGIDAGPTPILQLPGSEVDVALHRALLGYQKTPGWRTGVAHLLIPEDEQDTYLSVAAEVTDALTVGDPWEAGTDIGPIPGGTSAVTRYLAELTAGGAILEQGDEPEDAEHFAAPSVVAGPFDPSAAMNGDFNAPIVCLLPFPSVESAQQWLSGAYSPLAHWA